MCTICQGDCDSDNDCALGLVCFVRDSNTPSDDDPVPGCDNENLDAYPAKDFCVDESVWTCKDEVDPFVDADGMERGCAWAAEGGATPGSGELSRCEIYSSYCRETCGYCRTRTSGSASDISNVIAIDYSGDD